MYRKNEEEVVMGETKIWTCTSNDCNVWVRDNFKSSDSDTPVCPMCKSSMKESMKNLQVINSNRRF